ncbi:MAG: S24 family peptidase [Tannerellaceae bacterium]|nr:S24 family peptidase [Tannerellaceae bacterium]
MTTKERLKIFSKQMGYGRNKFEEYVEIASGYLSSRSSSVTSDTIEKVIRKFPELSLEWLLTGQGDIIKTESPALVSRTYPLKPYIDSTYAVCGLPKGFSVAVKETDCPTISLPFMKEYDFSIQAKGDSMVNRKDPRKSIQEGDIVVCRIWKSRSHLRWGETYALSTPEGIVIKKIVPAEAEGYIRCISFNIEEGYMPYDLPLEEINDWAIVVGVVSVTSWT